MFHFLSVQKERDLELAARIGQSLLKKNKALSERNELLEEQVEHIREEVHGLLQRVCVCVCFSVLNSMILLHFNRTAILFIGVFVSVFVLRCINT